MINPAELIDALVDMLRDIPELVSEMGGDEERIFAYHDRYPTKVRLEQAKNLMLHPGMMVAYEGVEPGLFNASEIWQHKLSLTIRAGEESDYESPAAYYRILRLVVKGVPTVGDGVAMNYATVHASFHPFGSGFRMERQTDAEGIDYFGALLIFTEIGDD